MKKNILLYLIDCFIYLFIMIVVIHNLSVRNDTNFFVYLTFIINTITSLILMNFFDKKSISLNKMFMIFILFFMIIAPSYQFGYKLSFWNQKNYSSTSYIYANFLIFIFLLIYGIASYNYFKKSKYITNKSYEINIGYTTKIILIFVSFICVLIMIYKFGFINLINGNLNYSNQILGEIVNHLVRFIPTFVAYIFIHNSVNKRKIDLITILSILLVIIMVFPFGGGARNYVAATYLFLFYPIFKKVKYNNFLLLLMTLGLLVFFSTIDAFRRTNFSFNNLHLKIGVFDTADYDAYQMFLNSIEYVSENGIFFGMQIVGSLLFFIPRNLWVKKPLSSGILLANYFKTRGTNYELYNNLSCPILGEFYLDFGCVGIALGAIIIGLLFGLIESKSKSFLGDCIKAALLSFLIYVSRGSLMSTVSKLVACIFAILLIYFLIKLFERKHKFIVSIGNRKCAQI